MDYVVPVSVVFAATLNRQIIEMSEAAFVQELEVLEICRRVDPQSPIETMVLLLTELMDPLDRQRVQTGYALTFPSPGGQQLMALHADTILIANFDSKGAFGMLEHGYDMLGRACEMETDLHTMVNEQALLIKSLYHLPSQLLEDLKRNQRALVNAHALQDQTIFEIKHSLRKQFQVYPIP